jgi:hypothetical protein
MEVYDLIECIVAIEGGEARDENDKARFPLFKKALVEKGDENAIKEYVQLIHNYVEKEQEEYQNAVTTTQSVCKIAQLIMEGSIGEHMDTDEQIHLYGNKFCMSSPHIDQSNLSRDDLLKHYLTSIDYAQETIAKNATVQKVASQLDMTDAVSELLLRLFIMYDKFNLLTGLTSSEFRAAASCHNLQDEAAVASKIKDLMAPSFEDPDK